MSKGAKKPPKKMSWTEEDMKNALISVAMGNFVRSTAKQYGMLEGIVRHRILMEQDGRSLVGRRKKITLDKAAKTRLAECIAIMCKLGFSPTREQMKYLVCDYVRSNHIKTPFKDDRPGKDWLRLFMQRKNLSLKANMISSARKSATSNPFIIFDFFNIIEEIIEEQMLTPDKICNCDESGFPIDPGRSKVVGVKGEVSYKVTSGAGRENITMLAACNAAGRAIDPLILFTGLNFQNTWRGKNPLPHTLYSPVEFHQNLGQPRKTLYKDILYTAGKLISRAFQKSTRSLL